MIGAKANEDRFLLDLYPYFLAQTSQAGLNGSIYFIAVNEEAYVFDDGFQDPEYPAIDGHMSLYWVYRSMDFLVRSGRDELGQAFAASYLARGLPEQVLFWSTPYGATLAGFSPPCSTSRRTS